MVQGPEADNADVIITQMVFGRTNGDGRLAENRLTSWDFTKGHQVPGKEKRNIDLISRFGYQGRKKGKNNKVVIEYRSSPTDPFTILRL